MTTPNLTAQRRARDAQLDAKANRITMQTLAARWGCSVEAVRQIPRERLPYVVIGHGAAREHRRYLPDAVARYEAGR